MAATCLGVGIGPFGICDEAVVLSATNALCISSAGQILTNMTEFATDAFAPVARTFESIALNNLA